MESGDGAARRRVGSSNVVRAVYIVAVDCKSDVRWLKICESR